MLSGLPASSPVHPDTRSHEQHCHRLLAYGVGTSLLLRHDALSMRRERAGTKVTVTWVYCVCMCKTLYQFVEAFAMSILGAERVLLADR